ncbi:MAG: hypothetical protein GXY01_10240 [Clostridiales bacterium]|mgnify:FL=1|nr:hypothetical protein [Clostridiales bacterium]
MKYISKKREKSILAGLLTFIMIFTMSFAFFDISSEAVSKSELNALKQQQEQLASKKTDLQAQSAAISSEIASQTERLSLLAAQLEVTNSELENLSEQIAIYTNLIAQMENELTVSKQKEEELLIKYRARVRVMEENGSSSYLSILFKASSFSDLLSRIDCVKEIMEYDNNLVNEVREAQVKVQEAKADMEAEMAAQQEVFAAYQEKQADLVAQQEEVKVVLASLTADSEDYAKQLESINALQASIGGQISNMEDKLAELERIKAEQSASAGQPKPGGGSNNNNNNNWYGESTGTGTGQDIVNYAMTFLGVKYVYGGTSPSGFDCSGLVYYCYKNYGYSVNRTAAGLAYSGTAVSSSDLQVGDILLFTSKDGSYIGHTGIYTGGGQFIHAPHTGDVVKISNLSDTYYTNHYWGARRVIS